jgi:hypothetical protein
MDHLKPPPSVRFDNTLHDFGKTLAFELGEAVWMFAKLESITFEYLRVLSDDGLDLKMSNVPTDSRLLMIAELAKRSDFGNDAMKQLSLSALSRMKALAPQRNTIVHNPWDVWFDAEAMGFEADIDRLPERKKTIAREELQRFTKQCVDVYEELANALSHFVGHNRKLHIE